MPNIQAFATVHRGAESTWRELGSFQDIAEWHPMVVAADGQGEEPGATRTLETRDGQRWVERLREIDADQRLYRYEVASTDLPIADFRSEFRVREDGPKKCTVVWTARFRVTSGNERTVGDTVREFFRAGVRSIDDRYAARPMVALRRRVRSLRGRYSTLRQ